MADGEKVAKLEVLLPYDTLKQVTAALERTGCSASDLVEQALRQFFSDREKTNAAYLSAPINALVEGLLVENTGHPGLPDDRPRPGCRQRPG